MEKSKMPKTERSIKAISATKLVYPALKNYKAEMDEGKKNGVPIVWCGGGITGTEIMHAMGMLPQHIDNMAAVFSAKQVSLPFIEASEATGIHHDLCSYYRTVFGHVLGTGKDMKGIQSVYWPLPDLLVGANAVCVTHPIGIRFLERHLKVPTFIIDTPPIHTRMDKHRTEKPYMEHTHIGTDYKHEVEPHYVSYLVDQYKKLVDFLEYHTKRKLDYKKLEEALYLSSKASELFFKIQDLRRAIPCPIGAEDIMSLVGPMFIWPGRKETVEIYEKALLEVEERVKNKEGVLSDERVRFFFEGIPPWYSLGLFNYIEEKGGISVIESYPLEFCYVMDEKLSPLENLAYKALKYLYNYSMHERADIALRCAKAYSINGCIAWTTICCKIFTTFASFLRDRLWEELEIPTLILEAEQSDPRDYAEAPVKARIDAFMEMLTK